MFGHEKKKSSIFLDINGVIKLLNAVSDELINTTQYQAPKIRSTSLIFSLYITVTDSMVRFKTKC